MRVSYALLILTMLPLPVVAAVGCDGDSTDPGPGPPETGTPDAEADATDSDADASDAGGDADASEGGETVVSNPGMITCGSVECDMSAGERGNKCCVRDAGAGKPVCTTVPNCHDEVDLLMHCDEPADCIQDPQPQRCYFQPPDGRRYTICRPDTGCNEHYPCLCKTDADCVGGDGGASSTCALRQCGQYMLRVCGTSNACP